MNATNKRMLLILSWFFILSSALPQCDIQNFIYPDGSMFYYIEPVNFYWTESKELKGGVVTDKENYYLALQPVPFPAKPQGHKLKDELVLKLANDSTYSLKHFDTRYLNHDSTLQMLFLIDKKKLDDFLNFEVISASINMGEKEGVRTYTFKLHKSAIKEQLACFLSDEKEKKKK